MGHGAGVRLRQTHTEKDLLARSAKGIGGKSHREPRSSSRDHERREEVRLPPGRLKLAAAAVGLSRPSAGLRTGNRSCSRDFYSWPNSKWRVVLNPRGPSR